MNIRGNQIPALIPAVAALLVLYGGCSGTSSENVPAVEPASAVLVRTAPVQRGDIARTIEVTGEVVAADKVTISSSVQGIITFFPWREGDSIARSGAQLVLIDREAYRAEVRAAESALLVARARLDDLRAGSRPEEIAQAKETVRRLEESVRFAKADRERIVSLVEMGALAPELREKADVTLTDQTAQLESARQRLQMLESGPTRTQLAVQEALVQEAESRLQIARTRLEECTIVAPFAGTVSKAYVRPGDMASAGTPLMELFDPSSLVLRFAVPERVAATVRDSMAVSFRLDAAPERDIRGRVIRVYPELDPRMRTRALEAVPDEPADLMPGMFARVHLALEHSSDVALVPTTAVVGLGEGRAAVFLVNDGKAKRRPVVLGIESEGRVEVIEGLRPGENIVVGGAGKLKEGILVTVSEMETPNAREEATQKGGMP